MPDHPKNSGKISREDVISGPIGKEDTFDRHFEFRAKKPLTNAGKLVPVPFMVYSNATMIADKWHPSKTEYVKFRILYVSILP